ncbi:hypothetical protein HMPREF9630_00912 [Peptoanaerobacter stomatis]|uniref:Methyltransferase domain-containing protein n=1 Tax=Peptoanaerobacter stomatis TaxID=796937 RepID=V9HU97_9FIRM|nr:class I SAM-dependent methyltransferase [Peptoanaerobacter stomatis]EHL14869.1 hypothetical protein HMPREF9630_00912 [Peptoanaerobacter stomatis]
MCEYKYLSNIYDKSMNISGIDYDKWFKKISSLMGDEKKNIKNILELGCGTGNLTKKFLSDGYEVVGIDKSFEMLEIAKQKTSEYGDKIILIQQDVCDIDFDIYEIDMILSANDLINYITNEYDLQNLFDFCYEHLRKDGLFIFDISSEYKISNILSNNTFFEEDDEYCMVWQNVYDKEDGIIDMYIDIFRENEQGLYERFQEEHQQRAYAEKEIDNILKKSGFKNIKKEYFVNKDSEEVYKNQYERIFYSVSK